MQPTQQHNDNKDVNQHEHNNKNNNDNKDVNQHEGNTKINNDNKDVNQHEDNNKNNNDNKGVNQLNNNNNTRLMQHPACQPTHVQDNERGPCSSPPTILEHWSTKS